MASYVGAISNFSPYIQQIPTEAYVKVGLEKQQEYESGIQRVQDNINKLAGLDMGNAVGKDYLQSRINQLTDQSNLHTEMDFSNPNNVNSLISLARPLYQDDIIYKHVLSASALSNYNQSVKDGQKAGDVEDFSVNYEAKNYVNPFLSATDVRETYNGPNTTLKGTLAKTREQYEKAFKEFTASKRSIQTANGNAYTVTDSDEYLDPERLKRYVLSQMDPDTAELLKRAGWANLSGLDDSTLKEAGMANYKQLWDREDAKVKNYVAESTLYPPDSQEYKAAINNAEYYTSSRDSYGKQNKDGSFTGGILGNLSSLQNLSKEDRDRLYFGIASTNFADGLSSAWGFDKFSRDVKIDEVWKFQQEQSGLNYRQQKSDQNAIIKSAIDSGQLIFDGIDDKTGVIQYHKNEYWDPAKAQKGTGKSNNSSSGNGDSTDGNGNSVNNETDEIAFTVKATGVDANQNVNIDNVSGVINTLQTRQKDYDEQMNQFLSNSGYEDLFAKDNTQSFNPQAQSVKGQLVVAQGKEEIYRHILGQITQVVQNLASLPKQEEGKESTKLLQYEQAYGTPDGKEGNLNEKTLSSLLNNPNLAKIVSNQTIINKERQNWTSVIRNSAALNAKDQEQRDQINNMSERELWQALDLDKKLSPNYTVPDEDGVSPSIKVHGADFALKRKNYDPVVFSDKLIKAINNDLASKSPTNEIAQISAYSSLQVKKNAQYIALQNSLGSKLIQQAKENEIKNIKSDIPTTFDAGTIRVLGTRIKRDPNDFTKSNYIVQIQVKKNKDENDSSFATLDVNVNDMYDKNQPDSIINKMFKIGQFEDEDIASRFAAGLNDKTTDKDGKPDTSKYMLLIGKDGSARYFNIRTMAKDPQTTQKQSNLTNGDFGANSFEPGKAYIEQLIPIPGGFKRVISRIPETDIFQGFSSYSAARLFLQENYVDTPNWDQFYEKRYRQPKP